MSGNEVKMHLGRIVAGMTICFMAASVIGAGYIAYDNSKTTKADFKEFKRDQEERNDRADMKVAEIEKKQARFEGKMDERSANTLKVVGDIWSVIKEWEPNR